MVAADKPDIEERVAVLEHNVQLLALALDHARTWLVLLGSSSIQRYTELLELEKKSMAAIDEVKKLLGGEL